MLQQIDPSEKVLSEISRLFKELGINKKLYAANIKKCYGISISDIFELIFSLTFYGRKMNNFLGSKRGLHLPGKDAYYRFLNNPTYSWRKFLSMLVVQITNAFDRLTSDKRVRVFVLDDSILSRSRTKHAELLARVFDHTGHRFVKGFTMLTLGWSDGYSFIPVDFAMLSSAKSENRLNDVSEAIDKRTNGGKRRKEAVMEKPKAALSLIENAISSGITADYVLMDSWFTNEPMIAAILGKGLHTIGMLKQMKQKYTLDSKAMSLPEVRATLTEKPQGDILGSRIVTTKHGIRVKLVFIKNRNNKREWLAILSSDIALDNAEIVRIYGMRWSIEVFFKSAKSLLKLGSEFQGRNFDMLISHTTIVFTRYILLEWKRRQNQDFRSQSELFYLLCDEIQDINYETAIKQMMLFFMELIKKASDEFSKAIISQVMLWIAAQPSYIKALMPDLKCET